jgi:hypothetical protein
MTGSSRLGRAKFGRGRDGFCGSGDAGSLVCYAICPVHDYMADCVVTSAAGFRLQACGEVCNSHGDCAITAVNFRSAFAEWLVALVVREVQVLSVERQVALHKRMITSFVFGYPDAELRDCKAFGREFFEAI